MPGRVSATAQWPLLLLALAGALAGTAGVYWDLGWHYDRGRDTVLSAPHLLIGAGAMVLGLAVAIWSLAVHRAKVAGREIVLPLREHAGVHYSPLLFVALVAALVPPVALSIDEVWHQLFGLDTSLWSPTHLVAILAGPVAMIAVSALVVWEMNQTDHERRRPELRALRGAGLAGALAIATFAVAATTLMLPWAEYDFDLPQWDLALAPPLLVAMLAFPTFLAAEAVGRRWTATLVLAAVAALRLLITGFVLASGQTAPDVVVPVLAGVAIDLVVIAGAGRLRGRTLAAALLAFPVAVIGSEAVRLLAIGQEKWLDGLFPYAWAGALAAGAAAGYLGVAAGRWMRPADAASPREGREGVRSARPLVRGRTGVAAGALCVSLLAAPQALGEGRPGAERIEDGKIMVPAKMEVTPASTRAGEPVTVRVSGFERARAVTPQVPSGEKTEPTGQTAPFLEEARRPPQVIAYYGGTWLREPLRRSGEGVFEARVTFPHNGNWRIGPFFYARDTRWTQRVPVPVASEDASASGPGSRAFELELAAEADPVDAPTWLKPIGFGLLGAIFVGALWLVVIQLRTVRDGGITTTPRLG